MIPTHFPVTMVDPDGHEYEVHSAMEYVSSRFKRAHREKPAPKPAPVTPAASTPAAGTGSGAAAASGVTRT